MTDGKLLTPREASNWAQGILTTAEANRQRTCDEEAKRGSGDQQCCPDCEELRRVAAAMVELRHSLATLVTAVDAMLAPLLMCHPIDKSWHGLASRSRADAVSARDQAVVALMHTQPCAKERGEQP